MKKLALISTLVLIALILSGCGKEPEVIDSSEGNDMTKIEGVQAEKSCEGQTGQKSCPKAGDEIAVIDTNYGTIKLKLFEEEAPKTVENFKKLIGEEFYDGLVFHRVIEGFMIQGGDPKGTGEGGPGYTIKAEISDSLSHVAGAVATARLSDEANPDKESSGSQFYIVHDDTGALNLDGQYTIFGQVVEGQNVVDKIATVETGAGDKPVLNVIIENVTIETYQ